MMGKLTLGLKMLFNEMRYAALIVISSVTISILFMYSMGALYLDPLFFNYFEFFEDGLLNISLNFVYVTIAPIFAGITVASIVYKLVNFKKSVFKEGSAGSLGFASAAFVTTCSNCVPVALYSLGITYGLFQAAFAPFVLPFKLLTIAIISLSFYFATTSLGQFCKLKKTRR